jgi:hypothetical protein
MMLETRRWDTHLAVQGDTRSAVPKDMRSAVQKDTRSAAPASDTLASSDLPRGSWQLDSSKAEQASSRRGRSLSAAAAHRRLLVPKTSRLAVKVAKESSWLQSPKPTSMAAALHRSPQMAARELQESWLRQEAWANREEAAMQDQHCSM